ncbi:MAG: hypothetical protein BM556_06405 [Bacteriovorax sp. MedPE-SWde]|nr:MAG: hypothetical protein BM556_06405 [Bacteriovorax sp. MedPE-SWde]
MKRNSNYIPVIVRTLLGAIFLISGTNSFMSFLPEEQYSAEGLQFINALKESGYLFALIKSMEILGGSMLIFNLFVPAVITLLAPIIVNIFLFELLLSDSYLIVPTILLACECYLFYEYRKLFSWLFVYQVQTHTNDLHPPELIILDQLKEENPEEYEHLIKARGVNNIIMR